MADSKISALTATTTVATDDMFPVATAAGATKKITGANLKAAMTSPDRIVAEAFGLKSQNWPLVNPAGNTGFTSQTIHVTGVPLLKGQIITNLYLYVQTAAIGTVPTSAWAGLCSPAAAVVSVSSDLKASSSWTATGYKPFAITSYPVPADGYYFAMFLIDGTFGTTQPLFSRASALGSGLLTPGAYGTGGTGQTALPALAATVTVTSASFYFWCGAA